MWFGDNEDALVDEGDDAELGNGRQSRRGGRDDEW